MDTHDVSMVPQYIQLLQKQKEVLEKARSRKGQHMVERKSCYELVMRFRFQLLMRGSIQARSRFNFHTSFIPAPYHPYHRSLGDLQEIHIRNLLLETHHRGKYILLRSITPPDRLTAVMTIVEDEKGNAIMLQLYYQDEESVRATRDILPERTILALKEPYLKIMADGDYGLRIDHPSDLVYLPSDDQRIPSFWKTGIEESKLSAQDLRKQGNDYYNDANYPAAVELYTKALKSTVDASEMQTLILNRALALIKEGRFDAALADLEGMISDTKPVEKALYREAQALYSLQRFDECCRVLTTLSLEYPDNVEAKRELPRATKRLQEQQNGTYNFKQLYAEATKLRPPHLDHATYTGAVAIRKAGTRGRGLFTTKAVKAGDLLLCEKAFAHAHIADETQEPSSKPTGSMTLLINTETNTITLGAQAQLI
ncbi:hypothetical protein PVAG01_07111 [Phlyctema vagabunda]|uniref:Uncharacterized protein n=1 Tax=Phlyctema vagabunda TaxID=108571 RepID=A0ABR4PCA1_9HELO